MNKMRDAFAMQKLRTFFNEKIGVIEIFTFEILTMSLVLSNWAQGPVVQSIISLKSSLRGQLFTFLRTHNQILRICLLKKYEKLLQY